MCTETNHPIYCRCTDGPSKEDEEVEERLMWESLTHHGKVPWLPDAKEPSGEEVD